MRKATGSVALIVVGVLLLLPVLLFSGVRIYKSITFGIEVTGHLKRAADANTVELARKELEVAVAYLERNNLTSGYTSILYQSPDEDISFWYTNLNVSLKELRRVKPDATQLEVSNVLMKLRETLLDAGEKSVLVTVPDGISVFPHNTIYAIWGWLALAAMVSGVVLILIVAG